MESEKLPICQVFRTVHLHLARGHSILLLAEAPHLID
jgi:hypothetical protein